MTIIVLTSSILEVEMIQYILRNSDIIDGGYGSDRIILLNKVFLTFS